MAAASQRPDPEAQAGRALRRLRLDRNWSQEEVAVRMTAYGHDFHQTMIAKIEAAQRPLRVRELADFAALYGVEVQDLVYPPTASLSETDYEIAEVNARLNKLYAQEDAARSQLEAAHMAVHDAQARYQASAAETAVLEGRLASLQAERLKLVSLGSGGSPSLAVDSDQKERDPRGPAVTSISSATRGATVLRILLGAQLRRLREAKRITVADAAKVIGTSRSKISRLETGQVGFKDRDISSLLVFYGVTEEDEREALLALAQRANAPGWWHDYSDVLPSWFEAYVGLEEVATLIRVYEVQFVPGLLQSEDYARAVALLGHEDELPWEIDRRVRLRMARQAVLDRLDPPCVWAVVDEAVLRRPIGSPAVMQGQLKHLLDLVPRSNVTIQVLPFQAGGHYAAGGPFSILRFAEPDLPDVVYLEQLTSALYLDKPGVVDHYERAIERACMQALTPEETAQLLEQLLDEAEQH